MIDLELYLTFEHGRNEKIIMNCRELFQEGINER